MVLMAASGRAATAYVTDELVLNVYSEQNQQGQRLATLHSGANVETLATSGDYTQVRLGDGVTGWVKSTFLTTNVPATVCRSRARRGASAAGRCDHSRAPLAEAAARSEADRLQGEARREASGAGCRARSAPAHSGATGWWGGACCAAIDWRGYHGVRRGGRGWAGILAWICHFGAAHQTEVRGPQGLLSRHVRQPAAGAALTYQ